VEKRQHAPSQHVRTLSTEGFVVNRKLHVQSQIRFVHTVHIYYVHTMYIHHWMLI
jgi:hypothetical protein